MTTSGMVSLVVIAIVFIYYHDKKEAREQEEKQKQYKQERERQELERKLQERKRKREWEALPKEIKAQKQEEIDARALASVRASMEKMERRKKETKDSIKLLISEFEDMGISQTMIKNIKKLSIGKQERLLDPRNFRLDLWVDKITELEVEELSLILDKETKPWKYEDHPIHMSNELKNEYLESDDWRKLKSKRLRLANNQCEVENCFNTKNLDLHHIDYFSLGNEDIDDVCIVCRNCHEKIHDRLGYARDGFYHI